MSPRFSWRLSKLSQLITELAKSGLAKDERNCKVLVKEFTSHQYFNLGFLCQFEPPRVCTYKGFQKRSREHGCIFLVAEDAHCLPCIACALS